jgi:hypothetical protein
MGFGQNMHNLGAGLHAAEQTKLARSAAEVQAEEVELLRALVFQTRQTNRLLWHAMTPEQRVGFQIETPPDAPRSGGARGTREGSQGHG